MYRTAVQDRGGSRSPKDFGPKFSGQTSLDPQKLSGKYFTVTMITPRGWSYFTERKLRPSLETGEPRSCDLAFSVLLWTSLPLYTWQVGSGFGLTHVKSLSPTAASTP